MKSVTDRLEQLPKSWLRSQESTTSAEQLSAYTIEEIEMIDATWDGIERRKTPRPPPVPPSSEGEFWGYVIGQFETLNAKIGALHMDMIGNKADIHHLHEDLESIKKAFPKDEDGSRDFVGHHDHHDGLIKASKKWSEIGTDVTKKLFGGIAWIVVVFVAMSIWEQIKSGINGKP